MSFHIIEQKAVIRVHDLKDLVSAGKFYRQYAGHLISFEIEAALTDSEWGRLPKYIADNTVVVADIRELQRMYALEDPRERGGNQA